MLTSLLESYAWLLDNWRYFHIFAAASVLIWVLFGTGSFRRAAKFFVYTAVFSVTVVMISTFFPFIGGKDYFFRTSIGLALIFYFLWGAFEAKRGEFWGEIKEVVAKPLFIAVSVFVLMFVLASLFALDPAAAFWSNFERGEGGFQMLHYWAFFALLVLLFKADRDWRWIFWVSVAAAVLMVVYGIIGQLGLAEQFISEYSSPAAKIPETFWGKLTTARFQGSLGNPAYVAPYLFFTLFYVTYLFLGSGTAVRKKILIYGGLAAFFLLSFFISQTRATFIGLGFAAIAFLVYSAVSIRRWRKFLILALAVVIVVGAGGLYFKDSKFVKGLPGGRVFDISFNADSFKTRTWTWGSAWKGFLERPILGWGPENFSPVFDKYFDPRHHVPGRNTETWFDRAHSAYFDYLAETGILGLAAYLGVFAAFFASLFMRKEQKLDDARIHKKEHGKESQTFWDPVIVEKLEKGLMLALVAGYMVQNIAIFEVLPMYINLFLFLGFAFYYFYRRAPLNPKPYK